MNCGDANILSDVVRKKMPREFRAELWTQLLQSQSLREKNPGVYMSLLKFPSEQSSRILRDVARTFPNEPIFAENGAGQLALLNVLRAYSIFDSELGYWYEKQRLVCDAISLRSARKQHLKSNHSFPPPPAQTNSKLVCFVCMYTLYADLLVRECRSSSAYS